MTAHNDHPLRPHLVALQQWAAEAEYMDAEQARAIAATGHACISLLSSALPPGMNVRCFGAFPYGDRYLVSFEVKGAVGTKALATLPAYFAVIAGLLLVPGFSLDVVDETGRSDKQLNRVRDPDEQIHKLNLKIAPRLHLGIRSFNQGIARTLFDVPQDAGLHETRGTDYHNIIPENHVLTKRRPQSPPRTRADVLASAFAAVTHAPAGSVPYIPEEMMTLLPLLFAIADRFHWDELLGRKRSDRDTQEAVA